MQKRALVTGAYGIVGMNVVEEMINHADWQMITTARRERPPMPGIHYVPADLMDAAATKKALADAKDCTHLFFCAFKYDKDPYKECEINVTLLKNTLDALIAMGAPLKRVVICEGAKAYGVLVGPIKSPGKESDPRIPGPLYYYALEDVLFDYGPRNSFTSTILRPDCIVGIGLGNYTNFLSSVAIYATICKAEGLPLYYPGPREAFGTLFQITDARLLARGLIWAAERASDKDEIFNITNGDLFRWSNVWTRFARYFDLEPAHPLKINLKLFMQDKGKLWAGLAKKHGLVVPFEQLMNWDFGDVFGGIHEFHTSTIRIRQAGFHECMDTDDRFFELFDEMRTRKIIP